MWRDVKKHVVCQQWVGGCLSLKAWLNILTLMFEQKAESKAMALLHAEKKVRGINLDTEMALRC